MKSSVLEPAISDLGTLADDSVTGSRRKTKIVCTLGPPTSTPRAIRDLIRAGANVFRLNFSHSDHQWHGEVLQRVREAAAELNQPVAIMQDLCGPKIRLSQVVRENYEVAEGDLVRITTDHHLAQRGDSAQWSFDLASTYQSLLDDVGPGDRMLIDDGRIELQVVEKSPTVVVAEVLRGGHIQTGKGLNLPGVNLSTESMTKKDWEDLRWGIEAGVDFVALSFVRHAEDLVGVHEQLDAAGSAAQVIAKIERPEAIENIEQILELADGLMVARGDLGLETDLAQVPMLQKHLIQRCRSLGKPVITATQMLESMVHVAVPTRAEVSDVANAIYDGSDAIMLSGETATGKYPVQAVEVLDQVAMVTERDLAQRHSVQDMIGRTDARVEAIIEGAAVTAKNLGARGVVIYTQSGSTARMMARYRLPMPLIAVTNVSSTFRQLNLSFGVHPVYAPDIVLLPQLLASIDQLVLGENLATVGDTLVVVSALDGRDGNTDTLHIHQVQG